jgi:hypothetical protein
MIENWCLVLRKQPRLKRPYDVVAEREFGYKRCRLMSLE